jgi:hypothetical protein
MFTPSVDHLLKYNTNSTSDIDSLIELFHHVGNKVVSGADLKRVFVGHTLVKLLKPDMRQVCYDGTKHVYYQYKIGLNEDSVPFRPVDRVPGGLYFTVLSMIWKYREWGCLLARVTIPDDAQVYIAFGCMKADKLVVHDVFPVVSTLSKTMEAELKEKSNGRDIVEYVAKN